MYPDGHKIDESISFRVKESFAGLLLLLVLGFPLWIPLALMITDLAGVNNPVVQMVMGDNADIKSVFTKAAQYVFSFVPAIFLYVWYKSSDDTGVALKKIVLDKLIGEIDSDKAQVLSWKPNGISGNPKNNKVWMQVKPALWAFKNTYDFRYFTYPVVIAAVLYSTAMSISAVSVDKNPFLAFFINTGFLVLVLALAINYTFYVMSFGGLMLRLKTNQIMVGNHLLPIESIEGIQVLLNV